MEIIAFWIICAIAGAVIASSKGSSGLGGCLWGLILGPIGVIIVAVVAGPGGRCPQCAKAISKQAVVCPYCRSSLKATGRGQQPVDDMTPGSGVKKKCPQCAEQVQAEAKVCRFCRWEFTAPGQGEQAVDDISRDSSEIAPERPISLQAKPAKGQPNRFAVVLVVAVILGAGLAIAQFNGSSNVSRPTSTTAAPMTTAAPVRQVFTADQVILPPEEFPLPGYVVAADRKSLGDAWKRTFAKPPATDELAVTLEVSTFPGRSTAQVSDGLWKTYCSLAFIDNVTAFQDHGGTGPKIGSYDRLCSFNFADGHSEVRLLTGYGAYHIEVQVRFRTQNDPNKVPQAIEVAASVAQRQVEILRRLTG